VTLIMTFDKQSNGRRISCNDRISPSRYQWCKQDQILKTKSKTKTTGSKHRHLADLTFK